MWRERLQDPIFRLGKKKKMMNYLELINRSRHFLEYFSNNKCHFPLSIFKSCFILQLQGTHRRVYGPPAGDRNIYEQGQLRVTLPPVDFQRQWPEIPRDYLKIGDELGSGAFGVVMKGYLMRNDKVIECAVKMLKSKCTLTEN